MRFGWWVHLDRAYRVTLDLDGSSAIVRVDDEVVVHEGSRDARHGFQVGAQRAVLDLRSGVLGRPRPRLELADRVAEPDWPAPSRDWWWLFGAPSLLLIGYGGELPALLGIGAGLACYMAAHLDGLRAPARVLLCAASPLLAWTLVLGLHTCGALGALEGWIEPTADDVRHGEDEPRARRPGALSSGRGRR